LPSVNFLCLLKCIHVSVVISVRVRKELKEELERLGIDYAEAVRRFLEELVARERRRLALEKAREVREKLRSKVDTLSPSAELIREDRDAGH
jgi:antitoxin component of RelBE/YafQ-DinJ toxin-antitoxin module